MSGYPTARALSKPAGRDRIVIDGVDVTRFRGYTTPFPRFLLTEPYAYGATSIQFPQVHATLEYRNPAVTDLGWARKGASVYIQRVMPDNSIVTDYVGVVIAVTVEGRILNLDVGGRVSGRATLIDKQRPKVRRVRDVGRWVQLACQDINVPVTPALGPVTGISIPEAGEMTLLGWLEQAHTMSQTLSGTQRALMPVTWGTNPWHFVTKDYTTKHFTLFTDDARVVLSLTDDAAEQPNTWFGSGVTPAGMRWDNSKYPGYFEDADPPDYPFADNRNFGLGTTDAETATGDGIEVLKDKLVSMGYLEVGIDYEGVYSQDIYDAVHDLKNQAGLSDNGTMTPAAWGALYDLDVTGYSNVGAAIYPLRQNANVRKWNISSNGNLLSRNDDFDPSALRVDRTIDFGPGVEKATARKFIQGMAARAALGNWTGQIRLNGIGAFAGEVNPADIGSLTADDVISYRDIRPGQNAWLPLFGGAILVHVSGVDVDNDGATLTVDSQARALMEVSEILARRRESRRDIRREWMVSNRGAKASGNMISRDEYFGMLGADKAIDGDTWNVFPVIAGQMGTINRVDIRTKADEAEFCVAIFSEKVTRKMLNRRIGNPFPVNSDGESVWESDELDDFFEGRNLLYAVGNEEQPCGYGRRKKFGINGNRTSAALTGRFVDDAGFPYITDGVRAPVVWVAIYPDRDCKVKRGPLLYVQEDDVV